MLSGRAILATCQPVRVIEITIDLNAGIQLGDTAANHGVAYNLGDVLQVVQWLLCIAFDLRSSALEEEPSPNLVALLFSAHGELKAQ